MTPRRGDVLSLSSPRIGFARAPESQLVIVLQEDRATMVLRSALVAPVEADVDPDDLLPFDVVVPATDLGTKSDHVVHVHLMRAVPLDALGGKPLGTAGAGAMSRILDAERLLLG